MRFDDELLQQLHRRVVKKFKGKTGSSTDLLKEIKVDVDLVVNDLTESHKLELSVQAKSWLASNYFRKLSLNGSTVEDLVVVNDYTLSEMTDRDISVLNKSLKYTWLAEQLIAEQSRRNAS